MDSRIENLSKLIIEQYNVSSQTASIIAQNLHDSILTIAEFEHSFETLGIDRASLEKEFKEIVKSPPLYRNRQSRRETPIEYYDRVWSKYGNAGLLFQDHLRKIDEQLINRVRHYCAVNHLKAADYLPPPRQIRTQRDAALGDPLAIAKLVQTMRLRACKP